MIHTLFIVDGNHLARRNHHKLIHLVDSNGNMTGATYGFVKSILKLQKEYFIGVDESAKMICVFDGGISDVRRAIVPEYKADRGKGEPDIYFRRQVKQIHKILGLMGIPRVAITGLEADDVIAKIALSPLIYLPPQDDSPEVVIISSDKDFQQLTLRQDNPGISVSVYDAMADRFIDRATLLLEFSEQGLLNITYNEFMEYRGMVGDSSDGIKGISGIGPKTAIKILIALREKDKDNPVLKMWDDNIINNNVAISELNAQIPLTPKEMTGEDFISKETRDYNQEIDELIKEIIIRDLDKELKAEKLVKYLKGLEMDSLVLEFTAKTDMGSMLDMALAQKRTKGTGFKGG